MRAPSPAYGIAPREVMSELARWPSAPEGLHAHPAVAEEDEWTLHLGDLTPRFEGMIEARAARLPGSPPSPGFTPPLHWHTPAPHARPAPPERASLRASRVGGAKPRASSPDVDDAIARADGRAPLERKKPSQSGSGRRKTKPGAKAVSLAPGTRADSAVPTRGKMERGMSSPGML